MQSVWGKEQAWTEMTFPTPSALSMPVLECSKSLCKNLDSSKASSFRGGHKLNGFVWKEIQIQRRRTCIMKLKDMEEQGLKFWVRKYKNYAYQAY